MLGSRITHTSSHQIILVDLEPKWLRSVVVDVVEWSILLKRVIIVREADLRKNMFRQFSSVKCVYF